MKQYVMMRRSEDNLIVNIQGHEISVEEIKERIEKWDKKDRYPELIEDEKALEIVRFLNRYDNEYMESDQQKINKYESAIEDIQKVIERL